MYKSLRLVCILSLVILLGSLTAYAVSPRGKFTGTWANIKAGERVKAAPKKSVIVVPRDYGTIQDAIDEANPGDKIVVQKGTYAGATVTKAVELVGTDAVINDGPNSHSFLRAGFLFPGDGVGSGATIRGFEFVGQPQSGYTDDGKLDFPIFSRGADNVTIEHNVMVNSLQAITNWHGSGWEISHNKIDGLWVLCGGGIGILIASWNNIPANNNLVAYNKITADVSPDCAFYTTSGITLYSDARWPDWGIVGGPVQDNKVVHNTSVVTGWWEEEPAGDAFEITDWPLANGAEPTVTDNIIGFNDFRGSTIEMYFYPEEAEDNNTISRNLGENRGHGLTPANVFRPIE